MKRILELSFSLAQNLPSSKIHTIADGLREDKSVSALLESVNSPDAKIVLKKLLDEIKASGSNKEIVASIMLSSGYTLNKINENQKLELVFTGPETEFVNSRKTEQVLLDLIANAKNELFLVSFVAKGWKALLNSIVAASDRGVNVNILMETSKEHGGTLDEDPMSIFRQKEQLKAKLYRWIKKSDDFQGGKIHAKIAVADEKYALISSANFTGHAMEKNFEAGVYITGGPLPADLQNHLNALVNQDIISLIE